MRVPALATTFALVAGSAAGAEPAGASDAAVATALPAALRPLARAVLAELVSIDTTHANGSTAAAEAIARRLRAAGFADADLVLAGPVPHKHNLVVRLRGAGKERPVLFIAHLDVVAAKREDWSRAPFALSESDGYLYGRGTTDMKGDVSALVLTLLRLRGEGYRPDRDVVIAFTDDEETGRETNGVAWLLRERPELLRAGFAVNPDGGEGQTRHGRRTLLAVQTSEKVFVNFSVEATDRGGHSSLPHAGNPVYRLAAALVRLGAHEFPVHVGETVRGYFGAMSTQESGALAEDLATLSREPTDLAAAARVAAASDLYAALMHTTCVATELSGGHASNALPQLARATVNCRVLPDESPDDVEATLRRVVDDPGVKVTRTTPVQASPPSPLVPSVVEPVERVMRQLFPGVRLAPLLSTGATDGLYLRRAGIPTYGISGMFGDVDDVRAHGRDERVAAADYYDGVEFMYRFVKELTGGAGARAAATRPAAPAR
jgi:acetylornithine deacetylase/succinyl-diaminopimelate desuccinylase-like protein